MAGKASIFHMAAKKLPEGLDKVVEACHTFYEYQVST